MKMLFKFINEHGILLIFSNLNLTKFHGLFWSVDMFKVCFLTSAEAHACMCAWRSVSMCV